METLNSSYIMRLLFLLVLPFLVLGCAKTDIEKCVDSYMEIWDEADYVKFGDSRFFTGEIYPSQTWEKRYGDKKYNNVKRKYTEYGWNSKAEHELQSWNTCSAMLRRR